MSNIGKDYNEFLRVHDPRVAPLEFGGGKFYRVAALIECVKCGRKDAPQCIQVLRIHRVQLPSLMQLDLPVVEKPMPTDEKIMTSMMLRACDNFVGCWNTCRPERHVKVCQLPSRRLLMAHNPNLCACPKSVDCTCPTRCGNKGIWPCRCGRMWGPNGKHRDACPVGLYKRNSQFSMDFMRSQLIKSHRA